MIDFRIRIRGEAAIRKRWGRDVPKEIQDNRQKLLRDVGFLGQREARRNAKFGPPGQSPGALERGIDFRVGEDYVDIFVPINAEAGKYAKRQHDELRGRGPGTIAKGSRAGWKFIKRAVRDNRAKILAIFRRVFDNI